MLAPVESTPVTPTVYDGRTHRMVPARSTERLLRSTLAGMDVGAAAVRVVAAHGDDLGIANAQSHLTLVREEEDGLGMVHARLQQVVSNVPVLGGDVFAHFDADGELRTIDSYYVPGVEGVNVDPRLDESTATSIAVDTAVRAHSLHDASVFVIHSSRLVVAAEDGAAPRLAYEVFVRAERGAPFHTRYLVDARSGVVFDELDNLMSIEATAPGVRGGSQTFEVTQQGNGYVMLDTTRTPNGIRTFTANNTQNLPGSLVTSNSLTQWNPAAVDAHAHATDVYDYYKKTFNRLGLNGNNGPMLSTVNFDVRYNNAFWDGTQMAYGDGDGRVFYALSAGLDVVAHEFTHGVITSTSNLVYRNMPGALNESVADIFGMFIEHEYKPGDGNFIMGEAIAADGRTMRDMKTPSRGRQPGHMNQYVRTTQDNGGVHINSGIPNNAAYLMTVGGTNPVSNIQVPAGLGWEKAAQLWYRANATYFSTTTDFAGAARGTQSAAQDLGFTDNEKAIVECAWIAVGVVAGTCRPISTTPPPGTGTGTGTTTGSTTGGTTSDPAPTPTDPSPSEEPTADPPADSTPESSPTRRRTRTRSAALSELDEGSGLGCNVGPSPSSPSPWAWAFMMGAAVLAFAPRRLRRRTHERARHQRPSR